MVERHQLGGTDGFRGVATMANGPGRMNWQTVAGLTHALIMHQTEGEGGGIAVIGRDTRPSSKRLQDAAISGAVLAGAEVLMIDTAPTPTVLRSAAVLKAEAAVMITASHNKYTDNGWKGTVGADKPYGQTVTDIDDRYWSQVESRLVIPKVNQQVSYAPELITRYEDDLVENIQGLYGEQPLNGKIVMVDAANGAAMEVGPRVLKALGATVFEYACDGSDQINNGTGATDLSGAKDFLRQNPELAKHPEFLGVLAFDGDADRLIAMGVDTDGGELTFHELEGNRVMELLAPGQAGVVGTEYTNSASIKRLEKSGIEFAMCPNGDVEVTRELRKRGWQRGSEFTGHHVDLSWLSSGDGVRTGALVAALAAANGTNFAEMSRALPLWPEKMLKLQMQPGVGRLAIASVEEIMTISGDDAAAGLRTVVRESGTEKDAMRIWASGPDMDQVLDLTSHIYGGMQQFAAK